MRDLVSRTTLYDLVWSVPMSRLARQLQMSDRGLAKLCARENIPVPPRGYWAKLQYGKPVKRPPLGPTSEGQRDWILVAPSGSELGAEGREWLKQGRARLGWDEPTSETREPGEPEHELDLHVRARETLRKAGRVRVRSSELTKPNRHAEIERMLVIGREAAWQYPFPPNPFRGEGPRRRLSFLNALFFALERLGARVSITDRRCQRIEVRFEHRLVPCLLKSSFTKLASGERIERLEFSVRENVQWEKVRQVWKERRGFRLDEHLPEILVGIALAVELERRERDWQECREALRRREEQRRAEERCRDERRAEARNELVGQARSLQDASAIRELVAAVRSVAPCDDPKVARWQAWALEQAEALDPVCGGRLTYDVPA